MYLCFYIPQICVQKQLSQYFRNFRRYSKSVSSTPKDKKEKLPAATKAKVPEIINDSTTQKRNLELLRDWNSLSSNTFTSLFEETFKERRGFIQNEATSCSQILEMCPYLGHVDNVSLRGNFIQLCSK